MGFRAKDGTSGEAPPGVGDPVPPVAPSLGVSLGLLRGGISSASWEASRGEVRGEALPGDRGVDFMETRKKAEGETSAGADGEACGLLLNGCLGEEVLYDFTGSKAEGGRLKEALLGERSVPDPSEVDRDGPAPPGLTLAADSGCDFQR